MLVVGGVKSVVFLLEMVLSKNVSLCCDWCYILVQVIEKMHGGVCIQGKVLDLKAA